jgi:aldehyde:ferredoxin oxidoreductase
MMDFPYGYMGKNLYVDLSERQIMKKDLDLENARRFIGGMGFGLRVLWDEAGPNVDPLSQENMLIFANGPLTGTRAPYSGRTEITTMNPLNGMIGSGNTGGLWGVALKRAGYDALVVKNESEKPVYLWINDDVVEIRDASHLWGKDAYETSDILKKELGSSSPLDIAILTIGQAGENLVKYACPINDYYHTAARCGAGAVMGAKKLKAIAVRGTKKPRVARPEELEAITRETIELIKSNPLYKIYVHGKEGPLSATKAYQERGCLPGKNFQTGVLPQFVETRGVDVARGYITKSVGACYGCPSPCFHMAEVKDGKYAGLKLSNATFVSTIFEWGAKCAVANLPAIWKCKEVCHRLGLDYGSASGSISFAMELFERGILTKEEVDGLELRWGNEDAIMETLYRIAYRKGFGDILAEGSVRAAKRIGRDAEKYVMSIKDMEMMWIDPRSGTKGWLFGYLTNPRGGDNIKNTHFFADQYNPHWWIDKFDMFKEVKEKVYGVPTHDLSDTWEGKAMLTKWFEDLYTVANALVICILPVGMFLALGPTRLSGLLSSCTGWDITPMGLMEIGERIFTLMKSYLVKKGLTRREDDWPRRFYTEPLPDGPAQGALLSKDTIDRVLDEYYQLRGWDKRSGNPTQEKLTEIGLEDIAKELPQG